MDWYIVVYEQSVKVTRQEANEFGWHIWEITRGDVKEVCLWKMSQLATSEEKYHRISQTVEKLFIFKRPWGIEVGAMFMKLFVTNTWNTGWEE